MNHIPVLITEDGTDESWWECGIEVCGFVTISDEEAWNHYIRHCEPMVRMMHELGVPD